LLENGRRLLCYLGLSAITVIAACSEGSGPGSDACPQTYEFGNFGCARVRGLVRNAAGEGVAGARVSLGPPSEAPNFFDAPFAETDATGLYSLEIHHYGPSPTGGSDTVSMYLRAFLPSTGAPIGDSMLVELRFAPVGEVPQVLEADITLD
jgi:hypothetical protein